MSPSAESYAARARGFPALLCPGHLQKDYLLNVTFASRAQNFYDMPDRTSDVAVSRECETHRNSESQSSKRHEQNEPANYPHKLTKTAEPWLGGSELHARVTSAAVRSCHFVLVAAAAAPLSCGRRGRRLLQLRVIALCGCTNLAVLILPNPLRSLLIAAAMSRANLGISPEARGECHIGSPSSRPLPSAREATASGQ